ncbi:hypothetical protein, partial [Methylorubrum rhodesianum]|uniref:hypothetical protein n=1 Tax=Methylorubrum rhodesianum TaxID=29427 RepID=UPI001AED3FC5
SSAPLEREASPLADFYTARISTKPTLQWMVLSPPYTPVDIKLLRRSIQKLDWSFLSKVRGSGQ